MILDNWWHWLRGFLDEVWFAKPANVPASTLTLSDFDLLIGSLPFYAPDDFLPDDFLSPDLILPEIDGAGGPVILGAYSSGGHYHFFVSDHPGSALTRKARDDWEDERNRRVFFQLLIDSQGGE